MPKDFSGHICTPQPDIQGTTSSQNSPCKNLTVRPDKYANNAVMGHGLEKRTLVKSLC